MINSLRVACAGAAVVLVALAAPARAQGDVEVRDEVDAKVDVDADADVNWTMASTYPSALVPMGALGLQLTETIARISGGATRITFAEPGEAAPVLGLLDAIRSGEVDLAWSSPGHWQADEPALALFAAVPFGPSAGEYLAWMYHGGGLALMDEIYAGKGLKSHLCGVVAPEAAGWFRKEITTVYDLDGLRMRFFGLGAKVLEKLGVSTTLMGGAEIYPALASGSLDATEYSMPTIDVDLKFHEVAKYYYFPGWHQQTMLLELIMGVEKWESLTDLQKAQIEVACKANITEGIAADEAAQGRAIAKLREMGAEIRRWPPGVLTAIEGAWQEVASEQAEADASFKKAWESLTAFRAEYREWKSLGYLP